MHGVLTLGAIVSDNRSNLIAVCIIISAAQQAARAGIPDRPHQRRARENIGRCRRGFQPRKRCSGIRASHGLGRHRGSSEQTSPGSAGRHSRRSKAPPIPRSLYRGSVHTRLPAARAMHWRCACRPPTGLHPLHGRQQSTACTRPSPTGWRRTPTDWPAGLAAAIAPQSHPCLEPIDVGLRTLVGDLADELPRAFAIPDKRESAGPIDEDR